MHAERSRICTQTLSSWDRSGLRTRSHLPQFQHGPQLNKNDELTAKPEMHGVEYVAALSIDRSSSALTSMTNAGNVSRRFLRFRRIGECSLLAATSVLSDQRHCDWAFLFGELVMVFFSIVESIF